MLTTTPLSHVCDAADTAAVVAPSVLNLSQARAEAAGRAAPGMRMKRLKLMLSPLRILRYGLVVRISGFHPGGSGSIPGTGIVLVPFWRKNKQTKQRGSK